MGPFAWTERGPNNHHNLGAGWTPIKINRKKLLPTTPTAVPVTLCDPPEASFDIFEKINFRDFSQKMFDFRNFWARCNGLLIFDFGPADPCPIFLKPTKASLLPKCQVARCPTDYCPATPLFKTYKAAIPRNRRFCPENKLFNETRLFINLP